MTALDHPVFWTPVTDPGTVLLEARSAPLGVPLSGDVVVHSQTTDGADPPHARVLLDRDDLNITFLPKSVAGEAFVALVILDEDTPDRLHAIGRLWAALRGRSVPVDNRMTEQRRKRVPQMLQTVDARLAGATYRSIGEVLFPGHKIDSATWAGDALREITIRLARDGLKLVNGGYRSLLRRPRR